VSDKQKRVKRRLEERRAARELAEAKERRNHLINAAPVKPKRLRWSS
jgi:hypothetical protein